MVRKLVAFTRAGVDLLVTWITHRNTFILETGAAFIRLGLLEITAKINRSLSQGLNDESVRKTIITVNRKCEEILTLIRAANEHGENEDQAKLLEHFYGRRCVGDEGPRWNRKEKSERSKCFLSGNEIDNRIRGFLYQTLRMTHDTIYITLRMIRL